MMICARAHRILGQWVDFPTQFPDTATARYERGDLRYCSRGGRRDDDSTGNTETGGSLHHWGKRGDTCPFRIETQALPGSGKTNLSGTPGSQMKESFETACDYLQANMRELRRDESLDEYDINVQVLNPSDADEGSETSVGLLVGIVSGILDRPVRSQSVVLGAMSLMGELVAVSSLVDKLQLAADSGAKTVLLPANNKEDLAKIPDELLDQLQLVFYTDPLDAASKAIELE